MLLSLSGVAEENVGIEVILVSLIIVVVLWICLDRSEEGRIAQSRLKIFALFLCSLFVYMVFFFTTNFLIVIQKDREC